MNETELDELLNSWGTPAPRNSLRESIHMEVEITTRRPPRRFLTWRMGVVAAVVVLAVMLVDSNAFSKKTRRYQVDSQVLYFGASNSAAGPPWFLAAEPDSPIVSSYNDDGSEVILGWASPDHPMITTLWKTRLVVSDTYDKFKRRFLSVVEHLDPRSVAPPDTDENVFAFVYPARIDDKVALGRRAYLLLSNCRPSFRGWEVRGQDTMLDYVTTVAIEERQNSRLTLWMAPELSCFALRATIEAKQPDGSWVLMSEKKAIRIIVNH
jgi:hypothetical protein